ncbi:TetR/AcrR family transcriptional regulator, partial [Pseudomonas citronellolis]|uniref:TetR/AcrR family transcriptional regulator n=1 Tax=Pseudomonas citronellolis TaxID=53408 RepID=UPI0023E3B2B8
MSGLRERQKEARRLAISQAAIELFRRQGFAATTVEQIAEQAGVSAPTVFNYFGSKQEILLELLRATDEMAVQDMVRLALDFDDPVDVLCHLESLVLKHELQALPVSVWRELLAMRYSGSAPEQLTLINETLNREVSALLGHLQGAGKVRANVDTDYAAQVLNEFLTLEFLKLVSAETLDLDGHARRVRAFIGLLFNGI